MSGFKIKSFITGVSMILLAAATDAAPSRRGTFSKTLPDGSIITVTSGIDEFNKNPVSSDGYTLVMVDGTFYFASKAEDGNLESSGIVARDAEWRTAAESAKLEAIGKALKGNSGRGAQELRLNKALLKNNVADEESTSMRAFPTLNEVHTLVILVEFADKKFCREDPKALYNDMLNKTCYNELNHIGSAKDYFLDQSGGLFNPRFDVYGPVTLSKNSTYYGENMQNGDDKYMGELILEACNALDGEIDFSYYDIDKDGMVDNIFFYYAGYGENADYFTPGLIWPHKYYLSQYYSSKYSRTFDGVVIDDYACTCELNGTADYTYEDIAGIGTFCHEFGHVLGLPDFYDTNGGVNGSAYDTGKWDIMASGSYHPFGEINEGSMPVGYNCIERALLGWATPLELTTPGHYTLNNLIENNEIYRISTSHDDEYFLIENRKKTGFDQYLPNKGMLIYHIDRRKDAYVEASGRNYSAYELWLNNLVNANASHMCCEIERALGNTKAKDSYSVYPITRSILYNSFTDTSAAPMVTWDGIFLSKPITNITLNDHVIEFDFMADDIDTGIDVQLSEKISVSVNKGMISISNLSKGASISIFNANGVLLGKWTAVGESFETEIAVGGIYFISVDSAENNASAKIRI